MTDDLERVRQLRERRRTTQPAGAFGPSARKRQQINRTVAKVDMAAERRDPAAYYAGQAPTPERITMALNLRDLYGPEVDQMLGGEEPMVDEWESGVRVPALEEVQMLAELTDYPVRFFYLPPPPPLGDGWICGSDGCAPLDQAGNGTKHLITGNHDAVWPGHRDSRKRQREWLEHFASVQAFARRKIAGTQVLLSHFPYKGDHTAEDRHEQYRLRDEGLWLLHGHTHWQHIQRHGGRQIHVGVDAWDLRPVSLGALEQVITDAEASMAAQVPASCNAT